jgi:hypothetical protein
LPLNSTINQRTCNNKEPAATQQQNSPQEDGGFTAKCQIVCGQTEMNKGAIDCREDLSEDNILAGNVFMKTLLQEPPDLQTPRHVSVC